MAEGNRYRSGKIKREHSITEGTLPVLEQIAALREVTAIIPGRIAKATGGTPRLTFQYFTESGLKLLSRTATAVQEIFVVCVDGEAAKATERKLVELGLIAAVEGAGSAPMDDKGEGTGRGTSPRIEADDNSRRNAPDASTKRRRRGGGGSSRGNADSGGDTSDNRASGGGRAGTSRRDKRRPKAPASKLRQWQDADDEALSHLGPRIDDETREALRRLKRRLK